MRKREHTGSLPLGTILGDAYKLQRRLAEGGMGTVYEAEQLRLRRRLAVKVMSRELAGNREAFSRFHREAEILSQLAHPHIVQIVDFGAAPAGQPYLVMEFLEGEDLERRLRRTGALPLAAVAAIVRQIGWALAATHGRGIVHRDLKPANVFLLDIEGEPDFVKVVDFGISKTSNTDAKLTRASVLMGTPHYMAPEQASGRLEAVDHRTDQWALGCIAWEMLSGRPPFDDREITTLFYNVVHAEPAPLAPQVPGLPADVEAVLRRALAKRPADRFASVTACCQAFEAAARGEAVALTAAAPRLAERFVRLARTIMGTQAAAPALVLPLPAPTPPRGVLARMTAHFRSSDRARPPEPTRPAPRRRTRWVLALGVMAAGAAWLLGPYLPARWPLAAWSPYMSPAPQAVSIPREAAANLARPISERLGR
jgi:serine/threonine protein kinase